MAGNESTSSVALQSCPETAEILATLYYYSNTSGPYLVFITGNAFLVLPTIFMNVITLRAILTTSSLRTPSYSLVGFLTLTDLGVGCIIQPLIIVTELFLLFGNTSFYCSGRLVREFISPVLSMSSYMNVVAISMDKYFAIALHLRYRSIVTVRRATIGIIAVWFLCLLATALKAFMGISYAFAPPVFACFALHIFFYIKIFKTVSRHNRSIVDQLASVLGQSSANSRIASARFRRSIYTMLYSFVAFLVCYTPFFGWYLAMALRRNFAKEPQTLRHFWLKQLASLFLYLNSLINPIIYCLRVREIRQAVRNVFPFRFICKRN